MFSFHTNASSNQCNMKGKSLLKNPGESTSCSGFRKCRASSGPCEGGSRKSPVHWAAGTRREFRDFRGLMFHPGLCSRSVLELCSLGSLGESILFQRKGLVERFSRTDQVGFSIPASPSWLIFSLSSKDDLGFQQRRDWLRSLCCTSHTDSI